MMITYGYQPKVVEISSGYFNCPNCNTQRSYKHKRLARYFTIFSIPLFQIKNFGEFIECQGCFKPFNFDVLEYDHQQECKQTPLMGSKIDSSDQVHSNLIVLWQGLYESLECETILTSKHFSILAGRCAERMKRAGASIFIKDYDTARSYLRGIYEEIWEWQSWDRKKLEHKLPTSASEYPELTQKCNQFSKAVDTLLKNLP